MADGYFKASLIMAKHSRSTRRRTTRTRRGYRELFKTLRGGRTVTADLGYG